MQTFRSVRYSVLLTALAANAALTGCGSHHEALVSLTISPPAGIATYGSASDAVQFTATGNFNSTDAVGGSVCLIPSPPDKTRVLNNANWTTSDSVNTSVDANGLATCLGTTAVPATITAVASGICGGVKATATLSCN